MSCNNFQESEKKRLTRRALITGGLAGAVWWASQKTALAQTTFGKDGNVVVVIFLRGGADGLNIVAPYTDDAYYKARPSLSLAKPNKGTGSLIKLDDQFALNSDLEDLQPIFESGDLAFIHAVGSGDFTRSHFEAMSAMERGARNSRGDEQGGWLARHLRSTPGADSPLRAVAINHQMPESLRGATQAVAIESLERYKLQVPSSDLDRTQRALAEIYANGSDAMSEAGRATLDVLDKLNSFNPEQYTPANKADYPDSMLGRGLKQIAFLARRDVGLEVACLDAADRGGWDTHFGQQPLLVGLLVDLGKSLAAFHKDMGADMSRVTVIVQSEFGRRLHENSSFGTDHGRAGVMFAMGGGVSGGRIVTDWPGLEDDQLEGPGDLRVTTDYRDVLTELLGNRLGNTNMDEVFPGHRAKTVGVIS